MFTAFSCGIAGPRIICMVGVGGGTAEKERPVAMLPSGFRYSGGGTATFM